MFVIDQIERPSDNSAAETNAPRSSMGSHPQFAVASVKQNNSGDGGAFCNSIPLSCYSLMAKPGFYEAKNEPIRELIAAAYDLTPVQKREISGGPKWIDSLRFDIEAKAEGNPSIDQRRLMLQDLLANRFKLVVHRTTKQSPVFALRLVNAGKNGPKLILHSEAADCLDVATGPPPGGFTSTNAFCGGFLNLNKGGLGHLNGNNVTLDSLAVALSGLPEVDRTVLDQTELKGTFDIALEYTLPAAGDTGSTVVDPSAPPILQQALKEQLGLKLESAQGPVEVLVIDHVEEPSEN